ncbi:MAG TPA: exopolysaccharide biosynthesis protein [Chthoniobacteraceae bacterium]|nr:exopolysaccharide biosynthesis protein [Chthoniobacteraceae bacterium]
MMTPPQSRLSADLERLLSESHGEALTLGEIEQRLKGRGFALLTMLLAVPFVIPNLPGLSTPFGLAIFLMGVRILAGRTPWLPQFVLKRSLSPAVAEKILRVLLKLANWMERLVRPRMHFISHWPGMRNLIGFGIAAGGLFLLLPLPLPLSNTFPAISILLLAAGMMERDGLCVLLGYAIGLLGLAYLGAWVFLGREGFEWFYR